METMLDHEMRPESVVCPINMMMHLISAKWTTEILRELSISPVRTRKFLRLIPGISMKCLQERLKALKAAGMIASIEEPQKVEYHITERGAKLFDILLGLKELAGELTQVNCVCPMEADAVNKSEDNGNNGTSEWQECSCSEGASSTVFYCPTRPQNHN